MTLTAVVVNYNAGPLLAECVRSLLVHNGVSDLRVVDNASTDDSLERLQQAFREHPALTVRRNEANLGYARAVNAELAGVRSEFVLVMNPDCRLEPGALERLWAALATNPRAALAAPAVEDRRGRPEGASLRRFPTPLGSFMSFTGLWRLGRRWPTFRGVNVPPRDWPREPASAEAVSGACMLLRRDALPDGAAFDEGYALHCEDLDLMYRLRRAGWSCLFVPDARAVHEQGTSSRSRPLWVHRQKHLGMRRFYLKFLAREDHWLKRLLVLAGIRLRCLLLAPAAWLRR
ncbi:MAG: glycosyltransferase family 2 protein [Gammaproteobacteria bacterium]